MANEKIENISEIAEKLFGNQRRDEIVSDIKRGDELMRLGGLRGPSEATLNSVMMAVEGALAAKRARHVRFSLLGRWAAAVMVLGVVFATVSLLKESNDVTVSRLDEQASVWTAEDVEDAVSDESLYSTELDDIKDSIMAIQLGETSSVSYGEVDELEDEYIESYSEFWKG